MANNNLWERSSVSANCQLCDNESPFFIPINRLDLVALRFQVPYQLLIAGALPIGANVGLKIVDEIGTTTIFDYGFANATKFALGANVDVGKKMAEYQIYAPLAFTWPNDTPLFGYITYYTFTASKGDTIEVVSGGGINESNFIYGIDKLPKNYYQVSANRVYLPAFSALANSPNVLLVNGTPVTMDELFSASPMPNVSNYSCFRFKLTFKTATATEYSFFTKPFKAERCNESVRLSGTYPPSTIDCNGYYHQSSFNLLNFFPNNLFIRIPADLEREANKVKKTSNSNCYVFKSEITKMFRMKSDPVPEWFADEVENLVLAQKFTVDNQELLLDTADQIFNSSDMMGSNYQNIDLSLSGCKCEKTFVCS